MLTDHSLGLAENRRHAEDRRRFLCQLAAQIFGLFLSAVCLWAVWRIGGDFVSPMPSADMGAW
jgi:hypothetical protein